MWISFDSFSMKRLSFNALFTACILIFSSFHANDAWAKGYTVFSNGRTSYSIVVSSKASESEKIAASELKYYIDSIGNVNIPILNSGRGSKGKRIIIGWNIDSRLLFPQLMEPAHNDDGFTYKSKNGDIIIIGGKDRGTMYGVYSFLENELGCRWLAEDCTVIPARNNYSFNCLDHTERPCFDYRSALFSECKDLNFRVHCRLNESILTSPRKPQLQKGGAHYFMSPHTMHFLLPMDKYYADHPDYYALVKGKREKDKTQPCFTHPDVLKICVNELRSLMRAYPDIEIFEVSGLDNHNDCECERCKMQKDKLGSYSDILLSFVNSVADSLRDEFPDKKIEFLAYQSSRALPHSVKPHNNVVVRFCSSGICHTHGMSSCNSEKSKLAYLDLCGWRELTNELYIWDYASNFSWYNIPYPNLYALQDNLQLYDQLGVKGVFMEGNHYSHKGEFYALKIYVLSKLMWDPYLDISALVDDFVSHYYGSSSAEIRQYFDLIYSAVDESDHLAIMQNCTNQYYDRALIESAITLFDKAFTKADTEEVLRRVEVEALSPKVVYCMTAPLQSQKDGTTDWVKRISERENISIVRSIEKTDLEEALSGTYTKSNNVYKFVVSVLNRLINNRENQ